VLLRRRHGVGGLARSADEEYRSATTLERRFVAVAQGTVLGRRVIVRAST
jgi:hypothetical protein